MPECLEAEIWRRALLRTVGRRVTRVRVDERVVPADLPARIVGEWIEHVDRHGKVVVLRTSGPAVGLHFGMTGRVEVDGDAPIPRLEYASAADRPEWDRLTIDTDPSVPEHPAIRMNDPRRLGRVSLDPDLSHLGPDVFTVDRRVLAARFAGRSAAVKAVLLDQGVVSGLGNLCADEVLYWAGVRPGRRVSELAAAEVAAVAAAVRRRLPIMLRRGGSTEGVLGPDRRRDLGPCTRCTGRLVRSTVGGRTAVWCPGHQR